MKLLIVGSRSINEFDLSPFVSHEVDTIISGGADGVDRLAEKYADDNRLSKYIMRPRYDLFGRAAPIRRNEEMVRMADSVLVVWDGASRGTLSTIKFAEKSKKPLTIIKP